MASTYIVQSAQNQTNGADCSLTLSSGPSVNNTLVLIVTGFNGTTTGPAGFTLAAANTSDNPYNATWCWTRTVQSGDGQTYTVGNPGDVRMAMLFEFTGPVSVSIAHGVCGISGATVSTGGLSSASTPQFRLLAFEWDNRGPVPASTPSGWTQLSGSFFYDNTIYSNHSSVIYQLPSGASGVQTLPLSGTPNYPVWEDIVITPAAGPYLLNYNLTGAAGTGTVNFGFSATAGSMLALIYLAEQADLSISSSGWSGLTYTASAAGPTVGWATKIASGGESSVVISKSSSNQGNLAMIEVVGANSALQVSAPSGSPNSPTWNISTPTQALDGRLRVLAQQMDGGNTVFFPNLAAGYRMSGFGANGAVALVSSALPASLPAGQVMSFGTFSSSNIPDVQALYLDFVSASASGYAVSVSWLF